MCARVFLRSLKLLFAAALFCAASAYAQRTMLVIQSFEPSFRWDIDYREGLAQEVEADYRFEYFSLLPSSHTRAERSDRAALAWERYLALAPDVVVLGDDDALSQLASRFVRVPTPVVYLGINNNPRHYGAVGRDNITGILERPLLKRSIVELSKLVKMQRVLLLFDDSLSSRAVQQEVFYGRSSLRVLGIELELVLSSELDEWRAAVQGAAAQHYDALFLGFHQDIFDRQGRHIEGEALLAWVSEHASVPPFTFYDYAVGEQGTIGGFVISGKDQGIAAAKVINQIDAGTLPGLIFPSTELKGRLMFSSSQLQKWGIALAKVLSQNAELTD
ncbi:MAG: ABC transporter substrate-binding protein [Pseudomonadales bacterium]